MLRVDIRACRDTVTICAQLDKCENHANLILSSRTVVIGLGRCFAPLMLELSGFAARDKERFPTKNFGLISIYATFSMLRNFLFGANLFDIRFCVILELVPRWCLGGGAF